MNWLTHLLNGHNWRLTSERIEIVNDTKYLTDGYLYQLSECSFCGEKITKKFNYIHKMIGIAAPLNIPNGSDNFIELQDKGSGDK